MSRREVVAQTVDEHGDEQHPAFGMIGASRVSNSGHGSTLFDSDIRHQHTVIVRIATATRKRDLNHDWLHRKREFVEVEMSEAQWASFVFSMNSGTGVPCTIRQREDERLVPGLNYEPRLAESMDEVHAAGERALAGIREAFEVAAEKPTKANMRHLGAVIGNAVPNMEFAATSLGEHAENVVQRARADIEAMVLAKAQHLGLSPGDLGETPQLPSGPRASEAAKG
jgi:hypothetical protein